MDAALLTSSIESQENWMLVLQLMAFFSFCSIGNTRKAIKTQSFWPFQPMARHRVSAYLCTSCVGETFGMNCHLLIMGLAVVETDWWNMISCLELGGGIPFPPPKGDSYTLELFASHSRSHTQQQFSSAVGSKLPWKEDLLLTNLWLREIAIEYGANPEMLFSKRLLQAVGLWGLRPFPCAEHLSHRSG